MTKEPWEEVPEERWEEVPSPTTDTPTFDKLSVKEQLKLGLSDLPLLVPDLLANFGSSEFKREKGKQVAKAIRDYFNLKEQNLSPQDKVVAEMIRGVGGSPYFAGTIPIRAGGALMRPAMKLFSSALSGATGGATGEMGAQVVEAGGGDPTAQLLARLTAGTAGGMLGEGMLLKTLSDTTGTVATNITGGSGPQIAKHSMVEIGGPSEYNAGINLLNKERDLFGEMYRPLTDAVFPDAKTLTQAKQSRISTAPLPVQAKLIEQLQNTIASVKNKADQLFGHEGGTTDDAIKLATQRYNKDVAGLSADLTRVDSELDVLTSSIQNKYSKGTAYSTNRLRSLLDYRQGINFDAFNAQYTDLMRRADARGVTFNHTPIMDAIKDTSTQRVLLETGSFPQTAQALRALDEAAKKGPVPFSLLKLASDRVNDAYYGTRNVEGKELEHYLYGKLKGAVNDAKATVTDPSVVEDWSKINKRYDEVYRETFQRGMGLKIKQLTDKGITEPIENMVISQDGAKHYKKVFGTNPEAMEQLVELAWQKFFKGSAFTVDGKIARDSIPKFIAKNEDFFKEFDNFGAYKGNPLRKAFSDVSDNVTGILARRDEVLLQQANLEKSALKKLMGFNNFEDAVKAASKDTSILSTVQELVKTSPEATQGFRRELVKQLMDQGEKAPDYLKAHRNVFSSVFSSDENRDIALIASGWKKAQGQHLVTPHAVTAEKTATEQRAGLDLAGAVAIWRRPIISGTQKMVIGASRIMDRHRARVTEQEIFSIIQDPRVLGEYAKASHSGDWSEFWRRQGHLFGWSFLRNSVESAAAAPDTPVGIY